jgi:hypothetical protein
LLLLLFKVDQCAYFKIAQSLRFYSFPHKLSIVTSILAQKYIELRILIIKRAFLYDGINFPAFFVLIQIFTHKILRSYLAQINIEIKHIYCIRHLDRYIRGFKWMSLSMVNFVCYELVKMNYFLFVVLFLPTFSSIKS